MRPVPKRIADHFIKANNLNQKKQQQLKEIRRLIIKENMRFFLWANLYDRYGSIDSLDVKRRIVYSYRLNSKLYRAFFGER